MNLAPVNLPALIALWARLVDDAARTGAFDDMRERIAVRHEIAQRLRVRPATAETRDLLKEFDDVFRAITTAGATCIHGNDRAVAEEWTALREWYFWRASPGA